MAILAVYAIIVVYVANSKVQACTPGEELNDNCGPTLTCDADGKWPTPKDLFDANCKRCYIHNDPHFDNFLDVRFDVHGTYNYSIAQFRWKYDPEYILSGKFEDCVNYPYATCIGEMVYKVSDDLIITFAPNENAQNYGPSSFELAVNDDAKQVIPSGLPTVISSLPQVVLAWRLGNCLMIMANKGYTIQFCNNGWYMYIWVPTSIERNTYGLCGHTDNFDTGKLLTRDGAILSNTPANVDTFATSWKTEEQNDDSKSEVSQGSACTANETMLANFTIVCTENIQADLSSELKDIAIENCVFDRCVIIQAINRGGNGNYSEAAEWLNQAVKSAENEAEIIKNTINLADACEGPQGYRGKCFGTQEDLDDYSRCDSLLKNATGCHGETCCVDCSLQTDLCNSTWENSVARNVENTRNQCCRYERVIGQVRPGSECFCCIRCKPEPECKEKRGRCITDKDPVQNKEWCVTKKNGTIHDDLCIGNGCSCCIWDRK